MAQTRDILLRIKGDASSAVKALDQVDSGLSATKVAAGAAGIAIAAVGTALATTFQALERGGQVANIARGFETLQTQAGLLANDSLAKLRTATQGLVSDFELMQQANQATQLGLDPGSFDELADAALKLGRAVGRDATDAFADLATGIGRESRLILDNLGILVKADDQYQELAATLGKTTKELTFQEKALEEVRIKSEALGDVQLNAADSLKQLQTAGENAFDEFSRGVAENDNLAEALQRVADAVDAVDLASLGAQLADLVGDFIRGTAVIAEFAASITLLPSVSEEARRDLELLGDAVEDALVKPAIKGDKEALAGLNKRIADTSDEVQELEQRLRELDNLNPFTEGVKRLLPQTESLVREKKRLNEQLSIAKQQLGIYRGGLTEVELAARKAAEATKEFSDGIKGEVPGQPVILDGIRQSGDVFQDTFEDAAIDIGTTLAQSLADGASSGAINFEAAFSQVASSIASKIIGSLGEGLQAEGATALVGASTASVISGGIDLAQGGEFGLQNAALLAPVTGGLSFAIDPIASSFFGSGKSSAQRARDESRGRLRETGLGSNLSFAGAGGSALSFNKNVDPILNQGAEGALGFGQLLEQATGSAEGMAEIFANITSEASNTNEQLVNQLSLLDEIGLSAAELKDVATATFLEGPLSAETIAGFNEQLATANQLQEQNLEGTGNMTDAFAILANQIAGEEEGSAKLAVKAIELALREANELGQDQVGELGAFLNSFGLDGEAVVAAFKQAGITSFEDWQSASADQVALVLSSLITLEDQIVNTFSTSTVNATNDAIEAGGRLRGDLGDTARSYESAGRAADGYANSVRRANSARPENSGEQGLGSGPS